MKHCYHCGKSHTDEGTVCLLCMDAISKGDFSRGPQAPDDSRPLSDATTTGVEYILKSEYDALAAERDRLRLGHYKDDHRYHPLKDMVDELTAERDQLRRELKIQDDANEILTRKLAEARSIISGKTFSYDPRALAALKECAGALETYEHLDTQAVGPGRKLIAKLRADFPELFKEGV